MWRRWFFAVVMLVARYAGAGVCTGVSDGAQCLLSDNVTAGTCLGGACTRTFTVPAGEARTGTGTISSSGVTVTGSGTAFTSELQVGDTLIAGGQRVAVAAIASNTSLTTAPAFTPAQSAASFTFANPIMKLLDESGNVVGLVDPRGLSALGQAYADGPLTIIGGAETGTGVVGKSITVKAGIGGPAGGSAVGGNGGTITLSGGDGGPSSSGTLTSGSGSALIIKGGLAGENTGGGPVGAGGALLLSGAAAVGTGLPGGTFVRGGSASGARGDVVVCDDTSLGTSYRTTFGNGKMIIDCLTGGFTKIRNVTVSAFPPTNAVGVLKNDGSGNYSLAPAAGTDFATQTTNTVFAGPSSGSAAAPTFRAVAMADLPVAVQNAVNAFVHANAGGI